MPLITLRVIYLQRWQARWLPYVEYETECTNYIIFQKSWYLFKWWELVKTLYMKKKNIIKINRFYELMKNYSHCGIPENHVLYQGPYL